MTSPFKSFLSEIASDPRFNTSLEQERIITKDNLLNLVNKARKLYLLAKLNGESVSSTEIDKIQIQLKDIALVLESIFVDDLVDSGNLDGSEYEQSFSLVGMIFEYIGDFNSGMMLRLEAYNWYLHASICYSLGHSPANSIVLAKKIDGHAQYQKMNEFDAEKYISLVKHCVLLLLTRSVHKAKAIAQDVRTWDKEVLSASFEQDPISIAALKGYTEISKFVQFAADYMITGSKDSVELAEKHLETAIHIFTQGLCSFESWLGDRLRFIFKQMVERSVWTKLASLSQKRPEYIRALISQDNPITELWPSQIAAIENNSEDGQNFGILGNSQRHFIVSMPTSAGKTRVAEIAIADAIDPRKTDACIYIVPTRALVNQVANDISAILENIGYRVGTAAGSYENIPGLEDALIEDVHVLVTTPEKLDMLDRSNALAVKRCKLFIFDECHKLEDAGRGLRLEILMSRLIQKNRGLGAKFILLSAVLPHTNLGEFVEWLGSEKAIDFAWRPTRLLEGVVYSEAGQKISNKQSDRPRREQFYGVEYPTLFQIEKLTKGTYFLDDSTESLDSSKIATKLALIYSRIGPVLLYCTTKNRAQHIAMEFLKSPYKKSLYKIISREPTQSQMDLAELIEDRLGKKHPLIELIKSGVAYHHASLPPDVKREIEILVKKGDIKIIASTTTLAEGLNTPVKTVIFTDVINTVFNPDSEDKKRKLVFQMDPKQFRNIAGRAGRALYDTEGHIILLDFHTIYKTYNQKIYSIDEFGVVSSFREMLDKRFEEVTKNKDRQTGLREFYIGKDATSNSPVRSRFFDLISSLQNVTEPLANKQNEQNIGLLLDEDKKNLAEEERFFQSGILALVCEQENIDPNSNLDDGVLANISENGVRNTLFAHQMKNNLELVRVAINYTARQAKVVSSRVDKSTRQVYNRTGLSLGSCLRLDEFIQNFIQKESTESNQLLLGNLRDINGNLLIDRLRGFLACINIPVETRAKPFRKIEITTSQEDIIIDWVSGKSINDIVSGNFRLKAEDKSDNYVLVLEATNYVYSHIVTYSAWALGAACALLKYYAEKENAQVNPEVWLLPAYTLYGVDRPIACFCVAMGVDDRDVALNLAEKYPASQLSQNYNAILSDWSSVKWWFSNITRASLTNWFDRKRKIEISWDSIQKAKKKFRLPELKNYEKYIVSCDLRGLMYENRTVLIKKIYIGYILRLVRESNSFDPNAIRTELQDGTLLGYIPKELAEIYAPLMDNGAILYAEISKITEEEVSVHIFRE